MKKICFGITKLGIGGAERVLVDIVNKLYYKILYGESLEEGHSTRAQKNSGS